MPDQRPPLERQLCPSARCVEGVLLLGIIGSDGRVGFISPNLRVNKEFVEKVSKGRAAEQRFRFAAPCQESDCMHWTGEKCAVIDQARGAAKTTQTSIDSSELLPRCGVRSRCRWFAQVGPDACLVCPFVFNYVWPAGAVPPVLVPVHEEKTNDE
jgi:hypothetical protein